MIEMIDTRVVEQRQRFTIRIFGNNGGLPTWWDVQCDDAADCIAKNDAAIAAKALGLIRSYAVRSEWLPLDEAIWCQDVDITDQLRLTER